MFDFAVIGAGVVGGMVARELTKYTGNLCILEKGSDVALGATRANSAIVHAGFDAAPGSLKAMLNVRGSKMMADVCSQLGVKYKNNGSLVVGFNQDDENTLKELCERGIANGVGGVKVIYRDEILALEPNVGDGVTVALYAPTGAIVCPYELCMASVGNAMDNGATLKLNFNVNKIEIIDGGFKVCSGDEAVEAKYVINCAGIYSDEIAAMVGDNSFTVRPRRGEYMLLDREVGGHISNTIFRCPSKMGKGVLVSPTVDGNLLLGPTAEDIDDKENTETTAEGLAKVRTLAAEQVSRIDFSKVITSFTGLRATGSTGDFVIGMPVPGFLNLAAIESPGLSSAPAIAEYTVSLFKEAGYDAKMRDDFNGSRRAMHYFSHLSIDEKNQLIKQRPEYAHVICRCETITEGEILGAIRTNPRPTDVDGVKRRTRASMGRCQGGFCTPYIIDLLAREMGVDYTAITKFGGNSYINFGKTK